jgi:SH3-like domain-containing protein
MGRFQIECCRRQNARAGYLVRQRRQTDHFSCLSDAPDNLQHHTGVDFDAPHACRHLPTVVSGQRIGDSPAMDSRQDTQRKMLISRLWGGLASLMLGLSIVATVGAPGIAQQGASDTGPSGLPVPRFVSLKSDRVHSRQGPGTDHKVLWVYRRAGLPVEVLREFEGWRQVRDSDGSEGWVAQALVSGRRTALVLPWEAKAGRRTQVQLHSDDRAGSAPVAMLEAGVIANIRSCDTRWCYVSVGDFRGYVEQNRLWGVYPGETIR